MAKLRCHEKERDTGQRVLIACKFVLLSGLVFKFTWKSLKIFEIKAPLRKLDMSAHFEEITFINEGD
jgi:hypothetical protein